MACQGMKIQTAADTVLLSGLVGTEKYTLARANVHMSTEPSCFSYLTFEVDSLRIILAASRDSTHSRLHSCGRSIRAADGRHRNARADRDSELFRANRAHLQGLLAELRERLADVRRGGGDRAIARHRQQGKLPVRERVDRLLDPGSPWLELSALAAWGMYKGEAPSAGLVTGIGRVSGREVMVVANDATVKGGTYFPDHGQEAPARSADRDREPPAVRLPGGFGRSLPPAPGRGVPRPRPFRSHLLQPGADVGRADRADGRGDGFVHGRRRLRARDVRRDGHRARHRHDLPRRAAAGEGRHGRRSHRRRAGRRRRAHPIVRRRRLLGRRRRARAAAGADHRLDAEHDQAARARRHLARRPPLRSLGALRRRQRRSSGCPTTCAR